MSFPTKSEREKCWNSRDVLWKCLDEKQDSADQCAKFREVYISMCPAQWVKHFDRKREYLKFKDRIQNDGGNRTDAEMMLKSAEDGSHSQTKQQPSPNQLNVPGAGAANVGVAGESLSNLNIASSPTKTRVVRKFQPWSFS